MGGAYKYRTHGEITKAFKVLVGEPEGKDYLEDVGVDERIKLKWILKT
jgi:hypothetical protein